MLVAEKLPNLPDWTPEQAEYWVAAAMAEARALRQHDEQLFPDSDDPATTKTGEQLRVAWLAWADGAEVVLARVRPLLQGRRHVAGAYDLDYAVGRARAMLDLTAEKLSARRKQLQSGQLQPVEEVRRELRTQNRG